MKKVFTLEQKQDILRLVKAGHGDALLAYGDLQWIEGYRTAALDAWRLSCMRPC